MGGGERAPPARGAGTVELPPRRPASSALRHGMLTGIRGARRSAGSSTGGPDVATAGQDGGPFEGPTVLRMLLGAQLRRLREAGGISREKAGWEIRASESKISR